MNKKKFIGYAFGAMMAIFFVLQGVLVNETLSTKEIVIYIIEGLVAGIVAALLFNFFMGLFKSPEKKG